MKEGTKWRKEGTKWRKEGTKWRKEGTKWRKEGTKWRKEGTKWSTSLELCGELLVVPAMSMENSASHGVQTPDDNKDELEVDEKIKEMWQKEQEAFKQHLISKDVHNWSRHRVVAGSDDVGGEPLQYVGGVDLSFVKGDSVKACAALVVVKLPELEVVYEDLSMVALTAPYIPGFLAFREVEFLEEKLEKLKKDAPHFFPQVVLVDGNGMLHPRYFGLACHLGVKQDIPTVGVAKNLFLIDGLEKNEAHQAQIDHLQKAGDTFPLVGASGRILGMALKSCDKATKPVYISVGHQVSLETAVWIATTCCKYRVPEPVRQADIRSREFLREQFPVDDSIRESDSSVREED
ncbi:Endonuclease V [Lamellibrachia satsuma]|nr:Endonuclease V [Lamellibrachia satsuma]